MKRPRRVGSSAEEGLEDYEDRSEDEKEIQETCDCIEDLATFLVVVDLTGGVLDLGGQIRDYVAA